MSARTISSVITVILLIVIGGFVFFIDLIALNGVGGSDGTIALATLGICQGVVIILSAIFAGRLTNLFITKYNWNNFLAIGGSVLIIVIVAVVLYIAAVLLSVGVAEALFYN